MPRLLVIDDSAMIRRLAAALLSRRPGWEVDAADSGEQAIAMVAAAPPDGVLLDLDMPGLDGIQTLERLRGLPGGGDLAVAFLTAGADQLPPDRLRELRVAGVVRKPLDAATAVEDVTAALGWGP